MRRTEISKRLRSAESVAVHGVTVVLDSAGRSVLATGIEKTFRKQPEVASVKVDLRKKLITITTKTGKTVSDAKIKEVVSYSGYSMGNIVRETK